jgi:hypothetical protein
MADSTLPAVSTTFALSDALFGCVPSQLHIELAKHGISCPYDIFPVAALHFPELLDSPVRLCTEVLTLCRATPEQHEEFVQAAKAIPDLLSMVDAYKAERPHAHLSSARTGRRDTPPPVFAAVATTVEQSTVALLPPATSRAPPVNSLPVPTDSFSSASLPSLAFTLPPFSPAVLPAHPLSAEKPQRKRGAEAAPRESESAAAPQREKRQHAASARAVSPSPPGNPMPPLTQLSTAVRGAVPGSASAPAPVSSQQTDARSPADLLASAPWASSSTGW